VRVDDSKAVLLVRDKPVQLYDLKSDIGERHDVARDHPDIVAKIEAYLEGKKDSRFMAVSSQQKTRVVPVPLPRGA
jgi:hypothetical protein